MFVAISRIKLYWYFLFSDCSMWGSPFKFEAFPLNPFRGDKTKNNQLLFYTIICYEIVEHHVLRTESFSVLRYSVNINRANFSFYVSRIVKILRSNNLSYLFVSKRVMAFSYLTQFWSNIEEETLTTMVQIYVFSYYWRLGSTMVKCSPHVLGVIQVQIQKTSDKFCLDKRTWLTIGIRILNVLIPVILNLNWFARWLTLSSKTTNTNYLY